MVTLLVVAGAAAFFFVRDHLELEISRARQLEALQIRQEHLHSLQGEAEERAAALGREYEEAQARYRQAERLVENLEALRNFWETLFRSREEREHERERLIWAQHKRKEIGWSLEELETQIAAASATLHRLNEHRAELQREREELEQGESEMISYAQRAWVSVRQPIVIGAAAFVFAPTIWKIVCYYGWAPLLQLGRPIRLRPRLSGRFDASVSQVSQRVPLRPGERAVLKEKFLQASDEALQRRTRFVFDWSIPFSSAACGLIELTEMVNRSESTDHFVTFSTQEDPTTELSVVEVAEGASLVLRPSYIAGAILEDGRRLRIERHWRLFSIHAWVTLQFRYFEFHGPCRLMICGKRGVRAEPMSSLTPGGESARRTNHDSTIGFTPNLSYHSARAETFWAYYRGRNPLFDDLFRGGEGAFICQEITSRGRGGVVRRFWSNFWGGLLKVFGL